ncbi:828_t:CDS:2, partial [Scutellospora calospora]
QQLQESINSYNLEIDFKTKVLKLINKQFEFAFYPTIVITNLLDLKQNDLEDIIIPQLENTYILEIAAYISIVKVIGFTRL